MKSKKTDSNYNFIEQTDTKKRGRLTIFLGAAAGVGKTYAMLEKALELSTQGIDVVVGWVGNHELTEKKIFLKGLPVMPPAKFEHRGKIFKEMDLKAILARRPQLVVVDDLAHINAPGSCHVNRYQDIEELLHAGIDVYTTLNIQQVESLKDIVAQITGIQVRETVPDRLLEQADYIKLIDVPPEELIQRLKEGKVSASSQEKKALSKPGNINALRELALRYAAQNVDHKLSSYMKVHSIKGPWPAGERIMACVGPSPFSAQVIRAARRMAAGLKAELIVAYVETPHSFPTSDAEHDQLARNLHLAEKLGAEVINLTGSDVAEELLALARRKNISQIVIGKPLRPRLRDLWKGSIVNKIIKGSQGISVHVIPGKSKKVQGEEKVSRNSLDPKVSLWSYIGTVLFILIITVLNKTLEPSFDLINIDLLYLLPVLFSAAYWGRGPSIMASLIGVLAFDIFFVPPQLSITVADIRYLLSFVIFLLVAIITSTMATRLRNQVNLARLRETRTAALYALSRKIVAETDIEGILNTVANVVADTVDGKVVILMPGEKNELEIRATTVLPFDKLLDNTERETAQWVFEHGQLAGKGTETFNESNALYLPLKSEDKNIGVLGVQLDSPEEYLTPEQRRLLEAFANLTAVAIVRLQLAEEAQQVRYLAQSEKLRSALFNSISHEVRTPLASIIGAVTSLLEEGEIYSQSDQITFLQTINESALRIDRLLKNLLDMARLESGKLQLKWEWCDIQEVIGVALRRLQESLKEHHLKKEIAPDLPLVRADFALIEQVLINLLDNAAKYSRAGSEIYIKVNREENNIKLAVADRGPRISEEDSERVFDKFYRAYYSNKKTEGTGLGLSICKGIVEAHGGKIWVEPNPEDGNIFIFTLPLNHNVPNGIQIRKGGKDAN